MSFAAWLLDGARPRAAAAAFVDSARAQRLTHAAWQARVFAAANALAGAGVKSGDRVVVLAPSSPDAAAVLVGAIALGAVAVPLPPADPKARLARMVARSAPVAVFADAKRAALAAELAPGAAMVGPAELDRASSPAIAFPPVEPGAPALVLFTSGSTGEPRGVVLSHENLIANTTSILASLPIEPADRMMAVLPFYYSFGASLLFTHLRAGACLVISDKFMFADRVLEEMIREECTSFAGVPSTYQLLLRRSSLPMMQFPTLRYVQQAGGRLAPAFVRELATRLPGVDVWLMYGQTEATARLSCLDPARLADKAHTIGRPIPGVTLEIVRPDGSLADPDETGEVVARGRSIALGYLDEPEATKETFRETPRGRSLFTGDIGKIDHDGFFVLVDRAKDFLKCAGFRVGMKEIEDHLVAFEGTVEAAVIGVPDELQGEAVKAFVVHPQGEAARAAFEEHCKRALQPHLQPRETVFLDALPKTAAGKLARAELKEARMSLDADVLALIEGAPYRYEPADKEARLCAILSAQVARQRAAIPAFARLVDRLGFGDGPYPRYEDVPWIHVSAFKAHDLRSVPADKVVRIITSSATTSGTPSRVHIDKPTSFRQARALAATLTDVLGKSRRPYLVLDVAESNADRADLSARGAAIRGLLPFASEVTYALDLVIAPPKAGGAPLRGIADGTALVPNEDRLRTFFEKNASKAPLLFGFTYIVWSVALAELERRGLLFEAPGGVLLHSGGWKKLTDIAVDRDTFAARAGAVFGIPAPSVLDFYGMAEQVGVVFIDCTAGNKHPPDFADVLLRDPLSLERVRPGQAGLIEVLSVLPESYPGQALLTDDVGILVGEDGCACGRRGRHFRIRSRVAQAEVRGCGDTFAQKRVVAGSPA